MTEPAYPPPVRVAVAQMAPAPGDVARNLARIGALVRLAAADGAQLVVVPETATTGYFIFDRMAELAEPPDGPTATALAALAAQAGVHLAVGMAISEGGRYFDAQILWGPDGTRLAVYRKVHLFASEREAYTPGEAPMVVDTALGRIGMSVCYDLIFPGFIGRLVETGADLVINSTNWITDEFQRTRWGWDGPTVRALAATRALENGTWLAMAACAGREAGFTSIGQSCLVAPSGLILAAAGEGQGVAAADLHLGGSADLARWQALATYRADRRPEHYRRGE
jgi:predicted amidohydrolase